jgi:ATP-binding cassette, subfamily B, bacterial
MEGKMKLERPKYSNIEFIKDLWHFIKKEKRSFIFLTILLAIATLLGLIPSIIVAKMINFFTAYNGGSLSTFYNYLWVLLIIGVFGTFLRLGTKHYFSVSTNKIQREVKVESFQKLMEGDLVWHDKENTGNKMQKVSSGASSIGDFMDFYTNQGIDMVVSLVGILIIFTYFDIKYAILTAIFVSVYVSVEFYLNKKVAEKTYLSQIVSEKSAGKSYEFSSNISTVKSLGIEKSLNSKVAYQEDALLRAKTKKRIASTKKWISVQLISTIFYVVYLLFVGRDIIAGIFEVGFIVVYVNYVTKTQAVLNNFSGNISKLTDIKYSIMRMMSIYKSIPIVDESNAKPLNNWNKIVIKDVDFGYKEEEVLNGFNLTINKGEKIGIVGKSGSGKSTLFKLLLKLYLPQSGMIYFDGKPITNIKKESLIKRMSIVPQETELFNISFKDNILLASTEKTNYQRYKLALLVSQSLSVVSKLNCKDMTLIGEKGVRLSGGERQRLGIARAIYKNSDIIIFDESTSNLDYDTERKIQDAIEKNLKNNTLLIAAHRLSTLRNTDRIIVLDKGKIVESGPYDELMKKKGDFYQLLKKQERSK